MKAILILSACALSFGVSASDITATVRSLDAEILAWKPGSEVPHRLLSFPDGKVPLIQNCGLAAYAFSAMPFIERIDNDALLEEIVFDPRSESSSLQAAVRHLVERKGLSWFAHKLASRESTRWELNALHQTVQSSFSRMEVAFISSKNMPPSKATEVLRGLKSALESGSPWKDAYAKVADENPDVERRKREPGVPTTLIGFWFDGWISASSFSFSSLSFNPNVPSAHLKRVVGSSGVRILESSDGIYLYNVVDSWSPDA